MPSDQKAKLLMDVVEDRKAVDPVMLDLRGKTLMFDFFLVCTGNSNVHIRAIADAVLEKADEADLQKPRTSGRENAEWVLLDFGDVVLHVMAEEPRERYRLEQFWSTPQPKGALPPTPDSVRGDDVEAEEMDDEDAEDAAFFDEADQEVEPIDEEDEELDGEDEEDLVVVESLEDIEEEDDDEGDEEEGLDAPPRGGRCRRMTTPPPEPAREIERDRLLTLANVQRMRGQLDQAQETLKKALALGDGQSRADAPIHEMLGDVLAADERWDEARTAYGTAHALDQNRASAERKFAQMTLRTAEAAQERAFAEAMLRGETPPANAGGLGAHVVGKRSPALAMFLSALFPGFGQLYNGQLVKALICIGVFLLAVLAINLSPSGKEFVGQVLPFFAGRPGRAGGEISPLLALLVLLAGMMWVYAVIDAPIVASKTAGEPPSDSGGPKVDKSGWEV